MTQPPLLQIRERPHLPPHDKISPGGADTQGLLLHGIVTAKSRRRSGSNRRRQTGRRKAFDIFVLAVLLVRLRNWRGHCPEGSAAAPLNLVAGDRSRPDRVRASCDGFHAEDESKTLLPADAELCDSRWSAHKCPRILARRLRLKRSGYGLVPLERCGQRLVLFRLVGRRGNARKRRHTAKPMTCGHSLNLNGRHVDPLTCAHPGSPACMSWKISVQGSGTPTGDTMPADSGHIWVVNQTYLGSAGLPHSERIWPRKPRFYPVITLTPTICGPSDAPIFLSKARCRSKRRYLRRCRAGTRTAFVRGF